MGAAVDDGIDSEGERGESPRAPPSVKVVSKSRQKRRDSGSDTDFRAYSEEESEPEAETEVRVQDQIRAPQAAQHPTGIVAQSSSNTPSKGGSTINFPPPDPAFRSKRATQASPNKALQAGSHRKAPISSKARAPKAKPVVISLLGSPPTSPSPLLPTNTHPVKPFARVPLPIREPFASMSGYYKHVLCPACNHLHPQGACELKIAGVEHCGLCGLAHFGIGRTCPHIRSETQVREMMQALKRSPESKELVDLATKYLRGVKGALVQQKKHKREKAMAHAQAAIMDPNAMPMTTGPGAGISRPPPGQYYASQPAPYPAPM